MKWNGKHEEMEMTGFAVFVFVIVIVLSAIGKALKVIP